MCRIFVDDYWEEISIDGEIPHLGYYQRYRMPDGSVNPNFRKDKISGRILDLKEKDERAINYFFTQIDPEIEKDDITICVVPSHSKSNTNNSGIAELGRRLANAGRIDGIDYLLRVRDIDKLATGGSRNTDIQYDSIIVNPNVSVSEDVILLIDDVTTTGTSLETCRNILMENGAKRVAMFAIGQTV